MARRLDDDGRLHAVLLQLCGRVDLVRTQLRRAGELRFVRVDTDDLPLLQGDRGDERCHAHAAQAHDHDRVAILRVARVDDGATAGQDRAAQDRGDRRRHVIAHRHDRAAMQHRMRREPGDAHVVVDIRVSLVESHVVAHQRARVVDRSARDARQLSVRPAVVALAAARQEDCADLLAHRQVRDVVPHLLHHARGLVAQEHRHGSRPVAVDDGQVGVAQARGADPDEDLVRPGLVQLEVDDAQWLAVRVRPLRRAHGIEDCSGDLHDGLLCVSGLRVSRR